VHERLKADVHRPTAVCAKHRGLPNHETVVLGTARAMIGGTAMFAERQPRARQRSVRDKSIKRPRVRGVRAWESICLAVMMGTEERIMHVLRERPLMAGTPVETLALTTACFKASAGAATTIGHGQLGDRVEHVLAMHGGTERACAKHRKGSD
jgi:hypothetical protein